MNYAPWTCPECGSLNGGERVRCSTCGNRPEDYRPPAPAPPVLLTPDEHDPIEDRKMLDELMDLDEGLTPWEREFIDSLSHWHGDFTEAQRNVLHRVYRDRT